MKNERNQKILMAFIFFAIGFFTNHLLDVSSNPRNAKSEGEARFPVNPDDFDQGQILDTISRMAQEGMGTQMDGVTQRQDDQFVYYDIPQKGHDGADRKLNVEIKDGMIRISEDVKSQGDALIESSSERMFTIDPALDADKAEVINEKDKIVIKIPKK